MEILSKNEILESQIIYYSILQSMSIHKNSSVRTLLFFQNCNLASANKASTINRILLLIKGISYDNDRNYKGLTENKISTDFTHMYINNKEDIYSKRETIGLVRNCLSHNDYNIGIENDEYFIEVFNDKAKPIPFYLKMSIDDLESIFIDISKYTGETKQIFMQNKHNPNEINLDTTLAQEFYLLKINNISEEMKKKLSSNSITLKELQECKEIECTKHNLSEDQKNKLRAKLEYYTNTTRFLESPVESQNRQLMTLEYNITRNLIPDGLLKTSNITNSLFINHLLSDNEYRITYFDILNFNNEKIRPLENREKAFVLNQNLQFLPFYLINYEAVNTNLFLVFSYIVENYPEDIIEIGRKKHKKNKLRNALVHGRWYFSTILNELSLFDYTKEYDYNFKEHIKLNKIYDFICKKIDLDKEKEKKNS